MRNRLLNRSMRLSLDHNKAIVVIFLIALIAVFAVPQHVEAQAKVGTTGAQFLELGVSARAMGMAEAFVATADDISAIYYNPAGLTALLGKEFMFTRVDMPADISYNFLGIGMPLESVGGVLGLGIYSLNSGEMIVRTYGNGVDGYPNESVQGTGQTFNWTDMAVSVAYGRYLTDRFSLGFSVKYIREEVHELTASGWAADVGTNYDTGYRGFKLAMAITNFGPDMTFIDKPSPLPINFRFGGSFNVVEGVDHLITLAAEGTHPSDNLEKYNAGVEYIFKERFSLRAGSRFNYDSDGVTAGGGMRLPFGEDGELRIDYAYQDFGILTEVHRFTISMAF